MRSKTTLHDCGGKKAKTVRKLRRGKNSKTEGRHSRQRRGNAENDGSEGGRRIPRMNVNEGRRRTERRKRGMEMVTKVKRGKWENGGNGEMAGESDEGGNG